MGNAIGQLMVELGINTAFLEEGLSKATYATKKFGSEVSRTFSELGKNTSELAAAFGALGPAGAELAGAFNVAGQAAGSLIKSLAGVNKEFGVFAAIGGGAVAGFAALGVAAIGMASHQAEVVKQMKEESIKAGMTTEDFSKLAWSAQKAGVSHETFASSMARFNNKLVQATQGNAMASAQFRNMGVSVADANGKIRPTSAILSDVSKWFEKTADGAVKNNAAMAVGGRGFMNMIAVLDRGPEAMKKDGEELQALGGVVTTKASEMAEAYRISMMTIEKAGEGVQLQIMNDLLPTMQSLADVIVDALKSPDSGLRKFAEGIADIAKLMIDFGVATAGVLNQIGQDFKTLGAEAQTYFDYLFRRKREGNSKEDQENNQQVISSYQEFKNQMTEIDRQHDQESKASWDALYNKFFKDKEDLAKSDKPKPDATPANVAAGRSPVQADMIKKFIEDTARETANMKALAGAIGEAEAKTSMLAAAQKGQSAVDKQMSGLTAKADQYKEKLKEMDDAGIASTDRQYQAVLQQQAQNDKEVNELKANTADIIQQYKERAVYASATSLGGDVNKKSDELREQTEEQYNLAAAIREGGDAEARAMAQDKTKQLNIDLAKHVALAKQLAAENSTDVAAILANAEAIGTLESKIRGVADAELKEMKAETDLKAARDVKAIQNETDALNDQLAALDRTTAGKIRSAAAEAGQKFKRENPEATGEQVQAIVAATQAKGEAQAKNSAKEKSDQLDILTTYQNEYAIYKQIADTTDESDVRHLGATAKMLQLNEQIRAELDKMALDSGNLGKAMTGMLDKIGAEVPKIGSDFVNDISQALNQFNNSLNQLIDKGKVNFRELGKSITKDFLQTGLKGAEGLFANLALSKGQSASGPAAGALGAIGTVLGGKKAEEVKPTGKEGDAFHTIVDQMPASAPNGQGDDGDDSDSNDGSDGAPLKVSDDAVQGILKDAFGQKVGAIAGAGSNLMQAIMSGVEGRAGGGDVTPGKAYMVGEEHPEFFVPKTSGTIAPTLKTGDGPKVTNVHAHFHGVADMDSFKRSQSQMMSVLGNTVGQSLGRK